MPRSTVLRTVEGALCLKSERRQPMNTLLCMSSILIGKEVKHQTVSLYLIGQSGIIKLSCSWKTSPPHSSIAGKTLKWFLTADC